MLGQHKSKKRSSMGGLLVPGGDRLVVVASKNPAKIAAATAAVQRCFPRRRMVFQGALM